MHSWLDSRLFNRVPCAAWKHQRRHAFTQETRSVLHISLVNYILGIHFFHEKSGGCRPPDFPHCIPVLSFVEIVVMLLQVALWSGWSSAVDAGWSASICHRSTSEVWCSVCSSDYVYRICVVFCKYEVMSLIDWKLVTLIWHAIIYYLERNTQHVHRVTIH